MPFNLRSVPAYDPLPLPLILSLLLPPPPPLQPFSAITSFDGQHFDFEDESRVGHDTPGREPVREREFFLPLYIGIDPVVHKYYTYKVAFIKVHNNAAIMIE